MITININAPRVTITVNNGNTKDNIQPTNNGTNSLGSMPEKIRTPQPNFHPQPMYGNFENNPFSNIFDDVFGPVFHSDNFPTKQNKSEKQDNKSNLDVSKTNYKNSTSESDESNIEKQKKIYKQVV